MLEEKAPGERYQRMPFEAEILLLNRGVCWDAQGIDISATGILVSRPEQWTAPMGGDFGIELVLDDTTISLQGRMVRVNEEGVAFEFTRIPPESEAPLWGLLGAFADATEKMGGRPAEIA